MYITNSDIVNTLGGLCGRRQEQKRKATMICQGRKVGSSFYTQEMGGGDNTGEGGRNIHGRCTGSGLRQFHKRSSSLLHVLCSLLCQNRAHVCLGTGNPIFASICLLFREHTWSWWRQGYLKQMWPLQSGIWRGVIKGLRHGLNIHLLLIAKPLGCVGSKG